MNLKLAFASAALAASLIASPAKADAQYSGTVTADFSDILLAGNFVFQTGDIGFFDNSDYPGHAETAVYTNSGSMLTWGSGIASTLTFTGATYSNVAPDEVFRLGTLTYFNGSSPLNSVIFGANLNLHAGPGIFDIVEGLTMLSTLNTFTTPARDSDFIYFASAVNSFNVYEGATASLDLYGSIVGDPQFTFHHFELLPGGGGFLGNGVGSATPEPAAWAMMLLGFGGLGAMTRRRRALAAA